MGQIRSIHAFATENVEPRAISKPTVKLELPGADRAGHRLAQQYNILGAPIVGLLAVTVEDSEGNLGHDRVMRRVCRERWKRWGMEKLRGIKSTEVGMLRKGGHPEARPSEKTR